MIELRWFERNTGVRYMDDSGWYQNKTINVLQYKMFNSNTSTWSDWKDVPTEKDVDVSLNLKRGL